MIKVKKLTSDAKLPTKAYNSAGYDLYSNGDWNIAPKTVVMVTTGLSIELPPGTVGLIADRSGLASKGITSHVGLVDKYALMDWVAYLNENEELVSKECILGGVIDNDYRGEWKVIMYNCGDQVFTIKKGDKIAQFLLFKCLDNMDDKIEVVDKLSETSRGEKGFGST